MQIHLPVITKVVSFIQVVYEQGHRKTQKYADIIPRAQNQQTLLPPCLHGGRRGQPWQAVPKKPR